MDGKKEKGQQKVDQMYTLLLSHFNSNPPKTLEFLRMMGSPFMPKPLLNQNLKLYKNYSSNSSVANSMVYLYDWFRCEDNVKCGGHQTV